MQAQRLGSVAAFLLPSDGDHLRPQPSGLGAHPAGGLTIYDAMPSE